MDLTIDGAAIEDEAHFHRLIRDAAGVPWYGGSFDALFDLLVAVVAPPIRLRIIHAADARRVIGARFDRIVTVVMDAVAERQPGAIAFAMES